MSELKMKIKGIPKCDFSKYETPVNIITSNPITEIAEQVTNNINNEIELKVKQAIGVDVDYEELKKAMHYDRGQYEKGWNDAIELIGEAIIELYDEHCGNKIISLVFEKAEELRTESEVEE